MKGDPKYHHYLPESYLSGFVDDSNLLSVYFNKEKIIKRLSPKIFGGENHFYTIEKQTGEKDTVIEKDLVIVDGLYMTLLRKIQEHKVLDTEDRANFSLILALFMTRIPRFRTFVEENLITLMKGVAHVSASHKESYYTKLERLGVPKEQWEETRQFSLSGDYTIEPNNTYSIEMMLKMALDIAPLFSSYNWYVGTAPKNSSFMTTDSPITLIPERNSTQNQWGVGLLSPGVTIHFALCKELLLGMKFNDIPTTEITYGKINREEVRKINHDLFVSSNKYVISQDTAWLKKRALLQSKTETVYCHPG